MSHNNKRRSVVGTVMDDPFVGHASGSGGVYAKFIVQLDDGDLLSCVCFERAAKRFEDALVAKGDRLSLAGRRKPEGEMVVDFFVREGSPDEDHAAARAEADKARQDSTRDYVKAKVRQGHVLAIDEGEMRFLPPDETIEIDGKRYAKLTYVMNQLGAKYVQEELVKAVQVPRVPLALAKKALVPKQGIRQKYLDALEKLVNEALFGRPDTYPTPENREDFSL